MPSTGTRVAGQIYNLEQPLGAEQRRTDPTGAGAPSGTIRPSNEAVDPLGSERLVHPGWIVDLAETYDLK